MRLSLLVADESFNRCIQSATVRSACRLQPSKLVLYCQPVGGVVHILMKHDPLRSCRNTVVALVQRGKPREYGIIIVCHRPKLLRLILS